MSPLEDDSDGSVLYLSDKNYKYKIRMKKYSVDRTYESDFKDSGSINYIDDTTDDEGLNEGERNRLVEKQQVRGGLMISYKGDLLSLLIRQ